MKHFTGSKWKILVMSALLASVCIALIGIVAADDLLPCQQWGTCNATVGYYGPGMMGGNAGYGGYGMINTGRAQMMESIEVDAMGSPVHEEMQGLVTNMMTGNLSSAERSRIVEIMDKYPGASNMMLTRRMGGYGTGTGGYPGITGNNGRYGGMAGGYGIGEGGYPGMMGGYGPYSGTTAGTGMMGGGVWILFMLVAALFSIVWLVAGILLVIWLLRQLQKDKVPS
ncbi:MAG: hypothetical protein WC379_04310 [Methanoregula sp.]|jgi:hypothetical protein